MRTNPNGSAMLGISATTAQMPLASLIAIGVVASPMRSAAMATIPMPRIEATMYQSMRCTRDAGAGVGVAGVFLLLATH